MSIVKRHDIIQTSFLLKDVKSKVAQIEKDKNAWTDLGAKEREILLENLHKAELNAIRQHANISIDHQKMLKAEFTETLSMNITTKDSYQLFVIPQNFNGFRALKNKYQYFKLNKVSVKFVANTANNLSPIVCRYLPPMAKPLDKDNTILTQYITKYAESAGTNWGFCSIHLPPCLIKTGKYGKAVNGVKPFTQEYCYPNLCKDRLITCFEDFDQYLDYGSFIFETRNESNQSVMIQLHYYIDFYTGYDYEAAAIEKDIIDGGDGDGDDPSGEEGGDDGDDPTHGGDANPEVPDEDPKPQVPPSKGTAMFKRRFKK